MVSPARLAANRANARRSTGPRTPAGKSRSALNALRHGLYARAVLEPALGETAADWASHRAAVRRDLAPEGAAEEGAADRIAWVMWRQRRVAACPAGPDAAALPPDPDTVTGDRVDRLIPLPPTAPPAARLAHARTKVASLRIRAEGHRAAAEALAGADVELTLGGVAGATAAAGKLLGWPLLPKPDPWVDVLRGLGVEAGSRLDADWTADLLRRAVGRAGGKDGRDPKVFRADVGAAITAGVEEATVAIARLEAEEAGLVADLRAARARAAAAAIFAAGGRAAAADRAEAHLSRELDRALAQFAKLRTLRRGSTEAVT